MSRSKIHVVEPPSILTMHAPFNAAFLDMVARAFPKRGVAFHATADHLAKVRAIVKAHAPEIEAAIEWLPEPEVELREGRVPASATWRAVNRALTHDYVVFTSVSRTSVAMMRLRMIGRNRGGVLAALHGELDTLNEPTPRFPKSLLSLQRQFRHRTPRPLRFILLGRSIAANVPPEFRPALADAVVVDHPYYFPVPSDKLGDLNSFGVFGNAGRAVELERFARGVRTQRPQASIRLIGSVDSPETAERIRPDVEFAEARIIGVDEFAERARGIRYTAWVAPPNSYRLRASATFLDALAYAKPILYTKNAFVDAYFADEPSIGLCCEDIDDLIAKVIETIDGEDETAYARRKAAILAFRQRFTPASLAPSFREATGWPDE